MRASLVRSRGTSVWVGCALAHVSAFQRAASIASTASAGANVNVIRKEHVVPLNQDVAVSVREPARLVRSAACTALRETTGNAATRSVHPKRCAVREAGVEGSVRVLARTRAISVTSVCACHAPPAVRATPSAVTPMGAEDAAVAYAPLRPRSAGVLVVRITGASALQTARRPNVVLTTGAVERARSAAVQVVSSARTASVAEDRVTLRVHADKPVAPVRVRRSACSIKRPADATAAATQTKYVTGECASPLDEPTRQKKNTCSSAPASQASGSPAPSRALGLPTTLGADREPVVATGAAEAVDDHDDALASGETQLKT